MKGSVGSQGDNLVQNDFLADLAKEKLKEYTGCGLVRAPPSVLVLAPVILKQFKNNKNPLLNESKTVYLFFIQKIKKMH